MLIGWLGRQMLPMLDGDGGGSGTTPPPKPDQVLAQYSGDAVRMAAKVAELEGDNFKQRNEIRDRDARIKELEAKQIPDGAVVLTGDDASQYQALNLKPADIAAKLKDADTTAADLAKARKAETIREAATVAGWKPEVLTRYGGNLDYEIREVEANGAKSKQVFVKDGENVKPAAEHFADLLPALAATQQSEGTRWVAQHSGDAPLDVVAEAARQLQEARDARGPNPLKPA